MKKFTRIIGAVCMMGLLTFVSTSCKKDKENGEMVITVSIPGIETDGDRAYIDVYGLFWWHEIDQIRVYNLAEEVNAVESTTAVYTKIGNQSTQIARFRGPYLGAKKAEGFRYFYPVNMVEYADENLYNENRQTFVVADRQKFHCYGQDGHHYSMIDPCAMPMATRLIKLSDNATLHHLFGVASFCLRAAAGTTVVVDSIKLVDNSFNLSGNVSLKLHKFYLNDSQGAEYSLSYAWEQFMNNYQGNTPEFLENVLFPWYEFLGYEVDGNTVGHQITLDCIYTHEDGETKGVTIGAGQDGTYFNFMLRPMALSEGFNLTVYIHDAEPVVLTQDDFEYGPFNCNYLWAVKPGYRKVYIKRFPLF